jgi:hypothetical protein
MCGVGYEIDSLMDRLSTTEKSAAKHEMRQRRRNEAAMSASTDIANRFQEPNETPHSDDADNADA